MTRSLSIALLALMVAAAAATQPPPGAVTGPVAVSPTSRAQAEAAGAASLAAARLAPTAKPGPVTPFVGGLAAMAAAGKTAGTGAAGAGAAPPAVPATPAAPAPMPAAADPGAGTKSRLNQLQFVGTRRSYHQAAAKDGGWLAGRDGAAALASAGRSPAADAASAAAAMPPLDVQAGQMGVRQYHFDAWADAAGGKYASWAGPKLQGTSGVRANAAAYAAPGFKVFADPDVDALSSCVSLGACLGQLAVWSAANPWHSPLFAYVEPRDAGLLAAAAPAPGSRSVTDMLALVSLTPGPSALAAPEPIDAAALAALDAEVAAAFAAAPDQLVTPDSLRTLLGAADQPLARALLARGGAAWPKAASLAGRVFVVLTPRFSKAYGAAFPALANASLFTSAPSLAAATPDDVFVDIGVGPLARGPDGVALPADAAAIAASAAAVRSAASRGFLVRTSADWAGLDPAAMGLKGAADRAATALASGAAFVQTDYAAGRPAAAPSAPAVRLPTAKGALAVASRCNPVTSLNPESTSIATMGCGQLVGDSGAPAASADPAADDAATPPPRRAVPADRVAVSSAASSDDVSPLPPAKAAPRRLLLGAGLAVEAGDDPSAVDAVFGDDGTPATVAAPRVTKAKAAVEQDEGENFGVRTARRSAWGTAADADDADAGSVFALSNPSLLP